MGIMDIVKLCYSKTVSGNRYDLKGATEHNMAMAEQHVLAEDMPKIESDRCKSLWLLPSLRLFSLPEVA